MIGRELEAGALAEPSFVPLAPVQWERLIVDGLGGCAHPGALLDLLLRRIRSACEAAPRVELLLRIVPTGPCPLAHLLAHEAERNKLEAELRDASGLLEVQLRPKGLHHPRDLAELRASPSALAMALELAEALEADPRAHGDLLPEGLASELRVDPGDAHGRQRLLEQLTEGLAEDLLSRVWDPSPSTR